jgi:hypothetical protein
MIWIEKKPIKGPAFSIDTAHFINARKLEKIR